MSFASRCRWSELEALFSELCGSVYIEVRTKTGTFLHEVARLLLPGGTATGGAEARERQRQVVEAAEALVGDPEPDVIAATARGAGKLLGCLDEGAARQARGAMSGCGIARVLFRVPLPFAACRTLWQSHGLCCT